MSTEVNLDKLYENSIKILSDLIGFKTISGEDNNDLINYCEKYLNNLGASSFKTYDDNKKRVNEYIVGIFISLSILNNKNHSFLSPKV